MGQTLSKVGDGMFPGALAVSIFSDERLGAHQGIVLGIESAAWVTGLAFGGAFADWFSRKRVIYVAEIVRIVALAALLVNPLGSLTWVTVCAAMMGLGAGQFDPSYSALVGTILRPEERSSGNAIRSSASNLAMMLGPALGGLLMGFGGVAVAYGFNLLTFLVSIGTLRFVNEPSVRDSRSSYPTASREAKFEALAFIVRTRWLTACLLQGIVILLCVRAPTKIAILSSLTESGHLKYYGVVLAFQSAGAVLGALIGMRMPKGQDGIVIGVSQALFAAPLLSLMLSSPWLFFSLASFLAGLGLGIFGVVWNTAIQREIPAHMLGRVYAAQSMALWGLDPLSLVFSPYVVARIGVPAMTTTSVVILTAALLVPFCVPGFRALSAHRSPAQVPKSYAKSVTE